MQTSRRAINLGVKSVATLLALVAVVAAAPAWAAEEPSAATTAHVLWQPSMNVFRRFDAPPEKMFEFYGAVLGFKQLSTINIGTGGGVARFQAGAQELKLTRRVARREYHSGGVAAATGLRLLSFFVADEAAVSRRFLDHGYPAPEFASVSGGARRSALVNDPDGQPVELVVVPGAAAETLGEIEVGLTVADLDRSRAFYSGFVGLEELPPVADERFGVTKYRFRHGATTISLRSFAEPLPADTGSGGIQYVVSDVDLVDELARARDLSIDQPLQGLQNFALRTIWLDDPDGITNYFAETGASRQARPSAAAE
jgi:catechol 2,3-dioxygenase-like lactoylglutathione lyase family enzyme